ncbi:MAG: SPASM domain-containing protein [Chloroflexota bacterium]
MTGGLDTIHVSIDAASPEVYRRIRVGADLGQTRANVERLLRARRRLGSRRPQLKLVMVLMRRNLGELPAVINLAGEMGFEGVFVQRLSHRFLEPTLPSQLRPLRSFAKRESLDDFDPDRLEELLTSARQQAAALGLDIRLPRAWPLETGVVGRARCDWPWTQAYVCYDGAVLPCCMVSTPDRTCLGSTREASLSEIWRGSTYQVFRQ